MWFVYFGKRWGRLEVQSKRHVQVLGRHLAELEGEATFTEPFRYPNRRFHGNTPGVCSVVTRRALQCSLCSFRSRVQMVAAREL